MSIGAAWPICCHSNQRYAPDHDYSGTDSSADGRRNRFRSGNPSGFQNLCLYQSYYLGGSAGNMAAVLFGKGSSSVGAYHRTSGQARKSTFSRSQNRYHRQLGTGTYGAYWYSLWLFYQWRGKTAHWYFKIQRAQRFLWTVSGTFS